MGFGDCIKCWDTPCTCGFHECDFTEEELQQRIDLLSRIKIMRQHLGPLASQNKVYQAVQKMENTE